MSENSERSPPPSMAAHPAKARATKPTTIMREKNLLCAPPVMAVCPAVHVPLLRGLVNAGERCRLRRRWAGPGHLRDQLGRVSHIRRGQRPIARMKFPPYPEKQHFL